jgi:uracil phosphoribosyltransferase
MPSGASSSTIVPLKVSSHPLVADSLRGLRDRSTPPEEFRVLARKVITLLLYEATADLEVRRGTVQTPLAEAAAISIEREVVAIPVLRAGLGLLAPVLELLPRVSVGYIGLERDEETAVARIYYKKLPHLVGKVPLLLDPMLATGGSAAQALDLIKCRASEISATVSSGPALSRCPLEFDRRRSPRRLKTSPPRDALFLARACLRG